MFKLRAHSPKRPRQHCFGRVALLSLVAGSCSSSDGRHPAPAPTAEAINWVRDPANPILSLDTPDFRSIGDPTYLLDGGTHRLWFSAVGDDLNRAFVGYSDSVDGITWDPPSMALTPSAPGGWDDQKVETPSVLRDDMEPDSSRRYKMYYGGASSTAPNIHQIGLAYSPDGMTWTRAPLGESIGGNGGMVLQSEPGNLAVEPSVLVHAGVFRMWYSTFGPRLLVVGYATSTNGYDWTVHPQSPVMSPRPGTFEMTPFGVDIDGTVGQPTVYWDTSAGLFRMWYGTFSAPELYVGIGHAVSVDGVTWARRPDPVFLPNTSQPGETHGLGAGPFVLPDGGGVTMYYRGILASSLKHVICRAEGVFQ